MYKLSILFYLLTLAIAYSKGNDLNKSLKLHPLEQNCIECHGPEKQKGKIRLDSLFTGSITKEKMDLIQKCIELISEGEMPPKKKKVLSTQQKDNFVSSLKELIYSNEAYLKTENQTHLRRLNNQEYLNSITELFGFNSLHYDPTKSFPDDQRYEDISPIHMR